MSPDGPDGQAPQRAHCPSWVPPPTKAPSTATTSSSSAALGLALAAAAAPAAEAVSPHTPPWRPAAGDRTAGDRAVDDSAGEGCCSGRRPKPSRPPGSSALAGSGAGKPGNRPSPRRPPAAEAALHRMAWSRMVRSSMMSPALCIIRRFSGPGGPRNLGFSMFLNATCSSTESTCVTSSSRLAFSKTNAEEALGARGELSRAQGLPSRAKRCARPKDRFSLVSPRSPRGGGTP
mmetsp:Transcript_7115/g.20138  ORF Transcript_7115/g.20138 Transcript_7115/m.20138 type:complete len:233 (-) Transcript_7115:393-1091(-)